jgi:Zn-finger nucleic acid-binding protein
MPDFVPSSCPACGGPLASRSTAVSVWSCERCHGSLLQLSRLRVQTSAERALDVWSRTRLAPASATRNCPGCEAPFRTWTQPLNGQLTELDACRSCELLWLDAGELDELRVIALPKPCAAPLASSAEGLPEQLLTLCLELLADLIL